MELNMFFEMFERMFALPLVIMLLSKVLGIVMDLMRGNGWEVLRTEEKTEEENKEEVKEEKKKINIDKDLKKYFNYKE